jgi:hypothetical protein
MTGRGQPVQLSRAAALYYNLAWSPDGQRVVATRAAARDLKEATGIFGGPLGAQFVWVPATTGGNATFSPSSRSTTRSTPCVLGCCGPMLITSSSVSNIAPWWTVGVAI